MNEKIKQAYEYGERFVVGASGGKDSTATCLHLIKSGVMPEDFDRVFMDTGWEHPKTYEYLDYLEDIVGKIHRLSADIQVDPVHEEFLNSIEKELGRECGFVRILLKYTMFPNHARKSCTKYLKLYVLRDWLAQHEYEPVSVTGIRRQESRLRASAREFEYNKRIKCYVWKPILNWSVQDVVDIHKEFKIRPNPLYLEHSDRVGCYPCIFASKSQIRHLDEKRRSIILRLEEYVNDFLSDKKVKTYFSRNTPFDQVYEWSLTSYGGKQFQLLDTSRPKCELWGLCNV